ncbi:MAG: tRNA pseudouridine(38-40) synthase TruA [Bacteroidota bacterium]
MKNYRLLIQYNGKSFSGWQRQPNVPTIQQQIEDSIYTITKERINLIGSGRTDTGVHALGQSANFRIDTELDNRKFLHSLNSILPNEIAIIDMYEVNENFHARFDAQKRSYLYIINPLKSPFHKDFAYYYPPIEKISINKLNEISSKFIGEYDFTSFAKKNTDVKEKTCNISYAKWRKSKGLYLFRIDSNRFLHGMVRTIVGTILEVAEKNLSENVIMDIIESKEREKAGRGVPPEGLFLYKVQY